MTVFAGIYARHPQLRSSPGDCQALRVLLSRHPDQPVEAIEAPGLYLVRADIGAYGPSALRTDDDGRITLVAGEPLLAGDGPSRRNADLSALHQAFVAADGRPFAEQRGVFCGVHYDPGTRALTLAGDRLGLRPLYYWVGGDWVVFATALRVLEESDLVPKRLDLRGITEHLALGYSLGRRTPYAGVSVLLSGEQVRVTATAVASTRVWRWDHVAPASGSLDDLAEEARIRFWTAVERRLAGDRRTLAYLSGGLDSRSIVTVLRDLGARVHTFNFAAHGSQDQVLGRLFAQAAGTDHAEFPRPPEAGPRIALLLAHALAGDAAATSHAVVRPRLVWSGDGGSVGLGHVYLTPAIVEHARAGRRDLVARGYLLDPPLARRLLTRRGADELLELPGLGIREEVESINVDDPGRAAHVFLMHNDQRRHLAAHFEDIDLHRMEFHLPFFDWHFLELILSIPVDACLGHAFYMRMLSRFPPVVTSTPWQTYPGHVPCPLPLPASLTYQWDRQPELAQYQRDDALTRARALLRRPEFPQVYWRRDIARVAYWLLRSGVRDTAAGLSQVATFGAYWQRCGGQVA